MLVDPRDDKEFMGYRRLAIAVLLEALRNAAAPIPVLPPRPPHKEMQRTWQQIRRNAHVLAILRREAEMFLLGISDPAQLALWWGLLGIPTPSRSRMQAVIDFQRQHQTPLDTVEDLCQIAS